MNTNKKTNKKSGASNLMRVTALLLTLAAAFVLTSCSLFRKATVAQEVSDVVTTRDEAESSAEETTSTGTKNSSSDKDGLRYTEDEAYNVLIHSFPDYDTDLIKIERTGNMIAEGNSTEYYIFNVSLPIIPETTAAESTDTEDADTTGETETTAPPVIEMAPPVAYYVSVNGVVHREVSTENVDTDYVRAAFLKNYGERSEATGFEYKLDYEGVLKNSGELCYNFAVYEINTSGEEPVEEYKFNYIVTADGKFSAETVFPH